MSNSKEKRKRSRMIDQIIKSKLQKQQKSKEKELLGKKIPDDLVNIISNYENRKTPINLDKIHSTLGKKHLCPYLTNRDRGRMSQTKRDHEYYRRYKWMASVNTCRKHGYYRMTPLCEYAPYEMINGRYTQLNSVNVTGDGTKYGDYCCPYLFLRVNNRVFNFSYYYKRCQDLFQNYNIIKTSLYQFYIENNNSVDLKMTPPSPNIGKRPFKELRNYYWNYYISRKKTYHNLFKHGETTTIRDSYLGILIDLNTSIKSYMEYFMKRGENYVIWRDFLLPWMSIYFPQYDNLIISNYGSWTREVWCLYLTCMLFKSGDRYKKLVNYPTNEFEKLFNYLDKNFIYLEKLVGDDKITPPWEGFILDRVSLQYIIRVD